MVITTHQNISAGNYFEPICSRLPKTNCLARLPCVRVFFLSLFLRKKRLYLSFSCKIILLVPVQCLHNTFLYLSFAQSCKILSKFSNLSASQTISKIYGNRKFWRLKLEFEVKNWQIHTKQLSTNLGCHSGGVHLSGGVP